MKDQESGGDASQANGKTVETGIWSQNLRRLQGINVYP